MDKTKDFLFRFLQRTPRNNLTVEFDSFYSKVGVTAMNCFVTNTAYYCASSAIYFQAHHTTA
jgi:polyphosphate kinase 2 (PPK2 family)